MTTRLAWLRLFVKIVALTSLCMGFAGYVGYARLDTGGGQLLFISPYYASVLLFCGLALGAARLWPRQARGWGLAVIGAMLLAHMAPQWSDAWLNGRSQFANVAAVLVLSGACAVLLLSKSPASAGRIPDGQGLAVGLLGTLGSVLIAYAMIERDILKAERYVHDNTGAIASDIGHTIDHAVGFVRRLGERWSVVSHLPDEAFIRQEFDSYLRDFPSMQRLAVVDARRSVVWERQQPGLSSGWIEELLAKDELSAWLERVQGDGKARLAPNERISGADRMGLIAVPLFNHDMRGWFVVARIDLTRLLAAAFSRDDGSCYFRVSRGDSILYQSTGELPADALAAGRITIPLHQDLNWDVSYWHARAPAAAGMAVLPEVVLLVGLTFTFFLISSQRLARLAHDRAMQLSHGALHDPLTGLANRQLLARILEDACAYAIKQSRPVSVVFFDMDGIKLINDSMGHDVGDRLLMEVSSRLQAGVQADGSVARLGGDEFVAVLRGLDQPQVQAHTQRLILALAEPYFIDHAALRVTASAGITVSDGHVSDPMQLVREADLAMVHAKQEGRNTWHQHTLDMNVQVTERLQLRNDLQHALDVDALELHYQPIVDGHSGRVMGVEALLRWPHAAHGSISPSRFIPLAEETGQIVPLSDRALAAACRDSALLRKQGFPPFPVIVNISPLYFRRADFVQKICRALQEAGLPAIFLEVEITEGLLLDNEEKAILKLKQLRDMGVKVSIDDFGTGYSSLSYLKNLPVDKVKIDRSFVADVVSDAADAAITQGIISMAHHLNLKVIAEGIETEAQFNFLRHRRCDEFQGYFFARPMSFDALRELLSQNGCHVKIPGLQG